LGRPKRADPLHSQGKKNFQEVVESAHTKTLLDFRLAGVPYNRITPIEAHLLENRLFEKNQLVYFQLVTLISAVQSLASAVVTGEANFSKTSENLKLVKDLLFPEFKQETQKKAERTKEIMEREMARGPMKVKPLDYGGGRKKNKKRR
jgi:hypothetical protein